MSYNEISGRYVELHDRIYTPVEFRHQSKNNRQASVAADISELGDYESVEKWSDAAASVYKSAWDTSYAAYTKLLSIGVAREQARGILPQALYTEFYMTGNLRSLHHFISLRDHEGAQFEVQQVARAMKQILQPLFPETFAVFEELENEEIEQKN